MSNDLDVLAQVERMDIEFREILVEHSREIVEQNKLPQLQYRERPRSRSWWRRFLDWFEQPPQWGGRWG